MLCGVSILVWLRTHSSGYESFIHTFRWICFSKMKSRPYEEARYVSVLNQLFEYFQIFRLNHIPLKISFEVIFVTSSVAMLDLHLRAIAKYHAAVLLTSAATDGL